jgi:YegS C-terminal NAD kinase beta sandwich-like domain
VTGPLRHGQPWGQPATGPPDVEIAGDDADLARYAARHHGALVRFRPTPRSDIARALGLTPDAAGATEVALDALTLDSEGGGASTAVNAVILGRPPDRLTWMTRHASISITVDGRRWFAGRATAVVVASGQFVRGADLVPRGHPGDGWGEVQVYALARNERRAMRRRLTSGTQVPHPRIKTARAHHVEIEAARALPLEVDGHARGRMRRLSVTVVPAAIRILV